jgi:hypothetical protein
LAGQGFHGVLLKEPQNKYKTPILVADKPEKTLGNFSTLASFR